MLIPHIHAPENTCPFSEAAYFQAEHSLFGGARGRDAVDVYWRMRICTGGFNCLMKAAP